MSKSSLSLEYHLHVHTYINFHSMQSTFNLSPIYMQAPEVPEEVIEEDRPVETSRIMQSYC